MDMNLYGFHSPLFHALDQIIDTSDEEYEYSSEKAAPKARRRPPAYVRDAKAMAATPADVIELPNSYVFIIDMPGMKSEEIKVQVEDNVLVINGVRKREKEKEEVKFLRMERRMGKFMKKFALPEHANVEKITAVCQDGVLAVTVEKSPPPEPKKPKSIQVQVA